MRTLYYNREIAPSRSIIEHNIRHLIEGSDKIGEFESVRITEMRICFAYLRELRITYLEIKTNNIPRLVTR
jgi:hypothetical protein